MLCRSCHALMKDYQQHWMQEVLGEQFVEAVDEVALDTGAEALVGFPSHDLPELSIVQLDDGTALFGLQGLDTPWWMIPGGAAWQFQAAQGTLGSDSGIVAGDSPEAQGAEHLQSSAAQLVQEFGHLEDNAHRKKRRK